MFKCIIILEFENLIGINAQYTINIKKLLDFIYAFMCLRLKKPISLHRYTSYYKGSANSLYTFEDI